MFTDLLIITIFPLAMALAAGTELVSMTVPNWISLLLVAGFVVLAPLVALGWSEAWIHVVFAVGALIITFGMFSFGSIGGGDAKLFAATCLWLGPEQLLIYAICAGIIGGVLTLLILLLRSVTLPAMLHSQGWLTRLHDAGEGVPYGIALAAAGLLAYPDTAFMAALGF
jgi:prepilin peptidase CpaA